MATTNRIKVSISSTAYLHIGLHIFLGSHRVLASRHNLLRLLDRPSGSAWRWRGSFWPRCSLLLVLLLSAARTGLSDRSLHQRKPTLSLVRWSFGLSDHKSGRAWSHQSMAATFPNRRVPKCHRGGMGLELRA